MEDPVILPAVPQERQHRDTREHTLGGCLPSPLEAAIPFQGWESSVTATLSLPSSKQKSPAGIFHTLPPSGSSKLFASPGLSSRVPKPTLSPTPLGNLKAAPLCLPAPSSLIQPHKCPDVNTSLTHSLALVNASLEERLSPVLASRPNSICWHQLSEFLDTIPSKKQHQCQELKNRDLSPERPGHGALPISSFDCWQCRRHLYLCLMRAHCWRDAALVNRAKWMSQQREPCHKLTSLI